MAELQPHEQIYRPWYKIMFHNFLGGLAWGVGSILGATVVIVLLGYLIVTTRQLPLIGEVVDVVIDHIEGRLEESELFPLPEQF